MFFIGSFNSAIPYIVYLSVIWAFMLIGVGGSTRFFRNTDQVYQEHHISVHQPYNGNHNGNLAAAQNITKNGPAFFPWKDDICYQLIVRHIIYSEFQPGSVQGYSNYTTLRGPPVQFC